MFFINFVHMLLENRKNDNVYEDKATWLKYFSITLLLSTFTIFSNTFIIAFYLMIFLFLYFYNIKLR